MNNSDKIIKKYIRPNFYNFPDNSLKKYGVFIDLETTGLDYPTEQIIEIAMVKFEYNDQGKIFKIVDEYEELQDSKKSITEFITDITGITNEMIKGKSIDENKVKKFLDNVDLMISFNAEFDRNFFELTFKTLDHQNIKWGCLYRDVNWRKEKIPCIKLECIAKEFGFYFDSHRAMPDCLAGLHILSKMLPNSKELVQKKIIENSEKLFYRIYINTVSDYENIIKNHGYRFLDEINTWVYEIEINELDNELVFLKDNLLTNNNKNTNIKIKPIDCFNRFLYSYRMPKQHLDNFNNHEKVIEFLKLNQ